MKENVFTLGNGTTELEFEKLEKDELNVSMHYISPEWNPPTNYQSLDIKKQDVKDLIYFLQNQLIKWEQ